MTALLGWLLACPAISDADHAVRLDPDLDGAALADDCDDTRADVFPGAPEVWYDGVDQDCDGNDDDQDGDGAALADDCDDTRADVFPGAPEVCGDGVDQNCVRDPSVCPTVLGAEDGVVALLGEAGDAAGVALASADLDGDGAGDLVVAAGAGTDCAAPGATTFLIGGAVLGDGGVVARDVKSGFVLRPPIAAAPGEALLGRPCEPDRAVSVMAVVDGEVVEVERVTSEEYAFGRSVAYVPDGDGDTVPERVFGGAARFDTASSLVVSFSGGARTVYRGGILLTQPSSWGLALVGGRIDSDPAIDLVTSAPREGDVETNLVEADLRESPEDRTFDAVAKGTDNAAFGFAIASCDLDGDGDDDLVAGAPLADSPVSTAGAVYVYGAPIAPVETVPDVMIGGTQVGGAFGTAVACDGDFDGDGALDLVVGAPGWDDGAGAAFVYLGGAGALDVHTAEDAIFRLEGPAGSLAGAAVAFVQDPAGEGRDAIAVGAPGAADGAGAVTVVRGRSAE